MTDRRVTLRLNQHQTELLDKTVARGEAADLQALVRRALREFAKGHPVPAGHPVSASPAGKA